MNICFLTAGFHSNGGIGRVVSILSDKLAARADIEVFLCSFSDIKAESYYSLNPKCHHTYLFPSRITMQNALLRGHAVKKLKSYIHQNKIDVIIACGALFYPLAAIVARKTGIKLVCWEHTDPNNKADYKFQDLSRKYGAKRSDCNVVLTKSALNIYETRFPKARNIQVYNPIDPILLKNDSKYAVNSKKIISVGRLRPQKNFSRLLDIAKEVLSQFPDWTWDIYGEGEQRGMLEEKCRNLGLESKVNFVGQVGDLYERYAGYSFMVMTSDYEGFPMTLLEGAANGLPMVAFDVPTGPDEVIRNGENGFICAYDSDSQMVEAICTLIRDRELRESMSLKCKDTVSIFDLNRICEQWVVLLKGLVK